MFHHPLICIPRNNLSYRSPHSSLTLFPFLILSLTITLTLIPDSIPDLTPSSFLTLKNRVQCIDGVYMLKSWSLLLSKVPHPTS